MAPPALAVAPLTELANTLLLYCGNGVPCTVTCTVKVTTVSSPSASAASPVSRRRSLPLQPPLKAGLTGNCLLPAIAGADGGVAMLQVAGAGKVAARLSNA